MLSNIQLKQFNSLKVKKFRQRYSQFLVEGKKSIKELTNTNFIPDTILFEEEVDKEIEVLFPKSKLIANCGDKLKKISSLDYFSNTIAVIPYPNIQFKIEDLKQGVSLFLDEIQDPGNLGTIIRLAVWYGFNNIVLSNGCADIFNPKTIQASMGAFAKINFVYMNKEEWVNQILTLEIPILGAFLEGQDIHEYTFPQHCIIVIGNEGSGISSEIENCITEKITIKGTGKIESLNAAMATAIILDNIYRGR